MTLLDKFYATTEPVPFCGCWLWMGAVSRLGYGRFHVGGGKKVTAHKWAYETLIGPVPDGLELDHVCRNRHCTNPAHLQPVTHAENVKRGDAGKYLAARTHCPKGHPYDEANTKLLWKPDGTLKQRACRICENARWRRIYHRRKAEGFNRNAHFKAKRETIA